MPTQIANSESLQLRRWFRDGCLVRPVLVVCVIWVLAGLAPATDAESPEASTFDVFGLVGQRLALMKGVAHWKYVHGVQIEDLDREAIVLDRSVAVAVAEGIDDDSVRAFFQSQIDAAKDIQHCWIARWQAGEGLPEGEPPDLTEQVRPQLLQIGESLIASLPGLLADGATWDGSNAQVFEAEVDVECLSADKRSAIYESLVQIEPKEGSTKR